MIKEKLLAGWDFILKHSMVVFPVIIVVVVSLTVTIALNAGNADDKMGEPGMESSETSETQVDIVEENKEIPMVSNSDERVSALLTGFYNARAEGDTQTLLSLCDYIEDNTILRYEEYSKYIDYYNIMEINTKPGPEDNSILAYVYYTIRFKNHEDDVPGYQGFYICSKEDGGLYIKRGENSDEVNEYIRVLSTQDDVVEFNNRITAEYNNRLMEKPEILDYINELGEQVNISVGERLGQLNASTVSNGEGEQDIPEGDTLENDVNGTDVPGDENMPGTPESEIQYVTAKTTVNVRSSDSEIADKVGKVTGGTKLQLVEERVNGWSEVIFEGKNAFIKTEYLEKVESVQGVDAIGKVTAKTNVNVRASASESADRLGVLSGGDSVNLLSRENGWCRIEYNGQAGYVKADYVE